MANTVKYPVKLIPDSGAKQSGGYPREIPALMFDTYQPFNTKSSLRINNFVWMNTPVQAGKLFLTSQGKRFILEAGPTRVIYVVINPTSKDHNKTFIQEPKGFIGDVVAYPFEKAGKNMQPTVKLAEFEVQLLIGIFSATSWLAFAAVVGMDALSFTAKNKDNFQKWVEIVDACLETRKDLKKYAPVLYDKLVYSTLLIAWEGTVYAGGSKGDIADNLAASALNDPNIVGRGAGIIVGKLGVNALNGRISILSAAWTILFTAATKAVAAVPGAVSAKIKDIKSSSPDEKVGLANQLITMLRGTDITLTPLEAKQIADEVMAHPRELKGSLTNLAQVFKKNSA